MRTIRASEIGLYLYCQRAWWYSKKGVPSENRAELAEGKEFHYKHGQSVMAAGCLRALAILLTLAGLALLTAYLTGKLF